MIIALGLLSGLLTTGAWLPQLLRTWRRGRADDISYGYLAAFAAGVLGWLAYGLLAEQPAVVAANLATFALITALAVLKTHPRRPTTEHPDERPGQRSIRRRSGRAEHPDRGDADSRGPS